jgi:hypothetical protein
LRTVFFCVNGDGALYRKGGEVVLLHLYLIIDGLANLFVRDAHLMGTLSHVSDAHGQHDEK